VTTSKNRIRPIEQIIEGHYDELKRAWKEHFPIEVTHVSTYGG